MCVHSRRDFLLRSAAAGALALGASKLRAAAPDGSPGETAMTIAKWSGSGDHSPSAGQIKTIAAKLTDRAIEGLGGMQRFVKKGDVVWIKPNIGWDRVSGSAGNTNPEVVAALVKMCFDAGAKTVKVGDNSVHAAAKTYAASGIADAVKPWRPLVFLDKQRYKQTAIGGERVKEPDAVSRYSRLRPRDQRGHREASRPVQRHAGHEKLYGRDGQSIRPSIRISPPV